MSLNFMAAVICSDFEPRKTKSTTVSRHSPSICHEVMGLDDMILVFWRLSFKPAYSLSGFPGGSEGKVAASIWETQVRSLVQKILWRRKWQPTLVLLPGKSHGRRRLVGHSPWGHKESDTTERLYFLSFFSFSSFTFIKRLFHFPSLSATRVVPSVYLRLLIFLPPIWSPAYASFSTAFHMIYPALS